MSKASENLKMYQNQLGDDGVMVEVSRQAVVDVITEIELLEAQNAVQRDALICVNTQKDGLSFTCANKVIKALSLTLSDAAEVMRNKDGVIKKLLG